MARATTRTHLSLQNFARIFGVNPVHFAGATGSTIWPNVGACGDVWPQWSWQKLDIISREDLAQAIHDAEEDIRRVLGFPVAPEYFSAEPHNWPKSSMFVANDFRFKTISARNARIVAPGRRAVTLIDADAAVVMSDENEDGFEETATIVASTTLTDVNEIKVYVPGHGGDPLWEIRPVKRKTIASGVVTIILDVWQLIDPELWEAPPTSDDFAPIDIENAENLLTTVDIYREYASTVAAQSVFTWEGLPTLECGICSGTGCASCAVTTQDGCLVVRDGRAGMLTPIAGTYDAGWSPAYYSLNREPDSVKIWYQAGNQSEEYLAGRSYDPLSHYLAQAIAYMAIARLEAPPCGCGPVAKQFDVLREDQAKVNRSINVSFTMRSSDAITNPFGTREGEVRAWNRVAKLMASEHEWKGGSL